MSLDSVYQEYLSTNHNLKLDKTDNDYYGSMDSSSTPTIPSSPEPSLQSNVNDDKMESSMYDRTWYLTIEIDCPDIGEHQDVKVRVRGDYTIGNVMARIGEEIAVKQDWSDYALWWPTMRRWLKNFRMTLDQVDVCANMKLIFTSMHKPLQIQLPDLNVVEYKVDFSVNVLQAVNKLCQEIDISHPEELSFARPLTSNQLKRNNPRLEASPLQRNYDTLKIQGKNNNYYSNETMNRSNGSLMSNGTISSNGSMNGSSHSLSSSDSRDMLLPHPKSAIQKARLNASWLNSSISLFEQDVRANDLLLLRFKYYAFYDLNAKELTRVYFLYEHLKWAILREEISCSEDDMYTLAGIMLHVTICSGISNKKRFSKALTLNRNDNGNSTFYLENDKTNGINGNGYHHSVSNNHLDPNPYFKANGMNGNGQQSPITINSSISSSSDEVDCALESLEKELEVTHLEPMINGHINGRSHKNMLINIPQLKDKLKVTCQKIRSSSSTLSRLKLTSNSEKSYFFILSETKLCAYRTQDFDKDKNIPKRDEPIIVLNMQNCEVNPDAIVSQRRYCFQIIDSRRSMEYCIKCQDETEYAKWFTACKQASLGRTMAHSSYQDQFNNTMKLLQIQSKFSRKSNYCKEELKEFLGILDPSHFVSPRFLKRKSKEQIIAKIKTAHQTRQEIFPNETILEAQMNFIKTCQTLRDYAITLFVVRFHRSKKEELLGAMSDKLVLIDINKGTLKKSWRYKTMKDWNINWEVKRMQINFEDEILDFECLSADCKVIHEFIGGYIYMSMRNEQNPNFDEEQFLKLTGGWNEAEFEHELDDEHIAMCRREVWANQIVKIMI